MLYEKCKTCQYREEYNDKYRKPEYEDHYYGCEKTKPDCMKHDFPDFVARSCATCEKECTFHEDFSNPLTCTSCKYMDGKLRTPEKQRILQETGGDHPGCRDCGEYFDKWVKKEKTSFEVVLEGKPEDIELTDDDVSDMIDDEFGDDDLDDVPEDTEPKIEYKSTFHDTCKKCKHSEPYSGQNFVGVGCIKNKRCGLPGGPLGNLTEFPDFTPKRDDLVKCRGCAKIKDIHDHRNGELVHGSCEISKRVLEVDKERVCGDFIIELAEATEIPKERLTGVESGEVVDEPNWVKCRDCVHGSNIHHTTGLGYFCKCSKGLRTITRDYGASDGQNNDLLWERACPGFEEKACINCKYSFENTTSGSAECPSGLLNEHTCHSSRVHHPGLWKWEKFEETKIDEPVIGLLTEKEPEPILEKEPKYHDCNSQCGYYDQGRCYNNNGRFVLYADGSWFPGDWSMCTEFKDYKEFDKYLSCITCRYSEANNNKRMGCTSYMKSLGMTQGTCTDDWRPVVKPKEDKQATIEDIEAIIDPIIKYSGKVPAKFWELNFRNCDEIDLWRAARWRFTKGKEAYGQERDPRPPVDGDRDDDVLSCYFCRKNTVRGSLDCDSCEWRKVMGGLKCTKEGSYWHNLKYDTTVYDTFLTKIDAKIKELENPKAKVKEKNCSLCQHSGYTGKTRDSECYKRWDRNPSTCFEPKPEKVKEPEIVWKWIAECQDCDQWDEDGRIIIHGDGRRYIECKKQYTIKCTDKWFGERPCRGYKPTAPETPTWVWEADNKCDGCNHYDEQVSSSGKTANCKKRIAVKTTYEPDFEDDYGSGGTECKYYNPWQWEAPNKCDGCAHWNEDGKVGSAGNMCCDYRTPDIGGYFIKMPKQGTYQDSYLRGKDCPNYKIAWLWEAPNQCDGCKHYDEDGEIRTRGSGKKYIGCANGLITKCSWIPVEDRDWCKQRGKGCTDFEQSWKWEVECGDCVHYKDLTEGDHGSGNNMHCQDNYHVKGDDTYSARYYKPDYHDCYGYKAPKAKIHEGIGYCGQCAKNTRGTCQINGSRVGDGDRANCFIRRIPPVAVDPFTTWSGATKVFGYDPGALGPPAWTYHDDMVDAMEHGKGMFLPAGTKIERIPPKPIFDATIKGSSVDMHTCKRIAKSLKKVLGNDYHVLVHPENMETKVMSENKQEKQAEEDEKMAAPRDGPPYYYHAIPSTEYEFRYPSTADTADETKKEEEPMKCKGMKCKGCGYIDDTREFEYCPECGRDTKKVGLRAKIKAWKEGRKEAKVAKLKNQIKKLEDVVKTKSNMINVNAIEYNDLRTRLNGEILDLNITIRNRDEYIKKTIEDREANYVALSKQLEIKVSWMQDMKVSKENGNYPQYNLQFKLDKLLDPNDIILFHRDLPDKEDE